VHSIAMPADSAPARLDVFLARHIPHWSRRTAQRAIATERVRINGRRARKGQLIRSGDIVHVADDLLDPPTLQPNPDLALTVLYEDAAVIAIDKPAGMPSHALRTTETATVANFLLARYPELATVGKSRLEPGIIHRLDTDTSGSLLVGRTAQAYDALRKQFAAQQVTKEYLALVHGAVTIAGRVDTAMIHDPGDRRRMRVRSATDSGRIRAALTYYRPLERLRGATLLSVQIVTGVMHQIRVHLASIGYPIIGDRLYGRPTAVLRAPRQLLHASRLAFVHPLTPKPISITSVPPRDFTEFVRNLKLAETRKPHRDAREGSKRGEAF
jgi:23S rRNA pseudouridine1911/1915/1917 synthase